MYTSHQTTQLSKRSVPSIAATTASTIERARGLLAECRETQRLIDVQLRPTVRMSRPYRVVVVPGQNGIGTETGYIQQRFEPVFRTTELWSHDQGALRSIMRAGIPTECFKMDFGQDHCKASLTEAMLACSADYPIVLYGNSQGTSTILQWLSDPAVDERLRKRVVMVVLEAVMASGNSAIWRTVRGWYCDGPLRRVAEFLCLDAMLCVAASWFLFRSFRAGDKQAVRCAESFPRDVPVILTHARQDTNLSYNDACAIQHLLKHKLQHPHVYLCTRMDGQHINLYQANIATMPVPNPRFAQVVQHVLSGHHEELPALFGMDANRSQAEHPVDGITTHEECYNRVMQFDRKVQICERVMRYAVPLIIITIIVMCVLYLV